MRSMTGFGRAVGGGAGFDLAVEAKSVNQRNLKISVNLPERLIMAEPVVREEIRGRFTRGHIRVDVRLELHGSPGGRPVLDTAVANAYLEAAEKLKSEMGLSGEVSVQALLGLPGMMYRDDPEVDGEELMSVFRDVMARALTLLDDSRAREGGDLAVLVVNMLETIRNFAAPVVAVQRASVERRFERMKERVAELVSNVELDDDRLLQELAVMVDRSDITEEAQRLISHVEHAIGISSGSGGAVGRKLEFILQEMHRELNTMGAKVDDSGLAAEIVEMKSLLASVREQVANVE